MQNSLLNDFRTLICVPAACLCPAEVRKNRLSPSFALMHAQTGDFNILWACSYLLFGPAYAFVRVLSVRVCVYLSIRYA